MNLSWSWILADNTTNSSPGGSGECGVYCEVKPYTTPLAELKALDPIGIIFTGGPNSVYLDTSPHVDSDIFTWGIPILGICYGCQLMAHSLGGLVTPCPGGHCPGVRQDSHPV